MKAFIILAVLVGAGVAILRKTDAGDEVLSILQGEGVRWEAEQHSGSGGTTNQWNKEQEKKRGTFAGEEKPDRNEEETQRNASPDRNRKQGGERADSSTGDSENKTDEAPDQQLSFKWSEYPKPVRRQVRAAKRLYKQGQAYYDRVEDDSLPLSERKDENKNARDRFQDALSRIHRAENMLRTPDEKLRKLKERTQEMYGKCFRRAKMWGGY